eukprot:3999124-Karenia_brevis.AAC.1
MAWSALCRPTTIAHCKRSPTKLKRASSTQTASRSLWNISVEMRISCMTNIRQSFPIWKRHQ